MEERPLCKRLQELLLNSCVSRDNFFKRLNLLYILMNVYHYLSGYKHVADKS